MQQQWQAERRGIRELHPLAGTPSLTLEYYLCGKIKFKQLLKSKLLLIFYNHKDLVRYSKSEQKFWLSV